MNLVEIEDSANKYAERLGSVKKEQEKQPEEEKAPVKVEDSIEGDDTELGEDKKAEVKVEVIEEKVEAPVASKREEKKKELDGLDEDTKAHLDFLFEDDDKGKQKGESKNNSVEGSIESKGEQKVEKKGKSEDDVAPIKEKAEAYEKLISNPLVNALKDFIETGGTDINEFATKVAGVDVSKMDARSVYEHSLRKDGYTDEDIEIELAEFDSYSKIKQDNFVKPLRDSIKKENEEKLKNFSKSLEGNREQQKKDALELQRVQQSTMAELDSQIQGMVNKKWRGLLVNDEMINDIKDTAAYFAEPIFDSNNKITGYDVKEGIRRAMLIKYEKQLFKANYELGKTTGLDEALRERHRPSKNDSSTTVSVVQKMDVSEAAKAAGAQMWEQRKSKF